MSSTEKHPDGGTYRVIAQAATIGGWAAFVTEWMTYRGTVLFEVLRATPPGTFRPGTRATARLHLAATETEARQLANRVCAADRGRPASVAA